MNIVTEFGRTEEVDGHDTPKDEQRPEKDPVHQGTLVLQEIP